jgi:hypothetical protein
MDQHRKSSSKKQYSAPELIVYGTVADITRFYGVASTGDFLISGSQSFNLGTTGSTPGYIYYQPRP